MSIRYHQPTCTKAQKYRTEPYADDQTGACNDERAVARFPIPLQKRSRAEAPKRKFMWKNSQLRAPKLHQYASENAHACGGSPFPPTNEEQDEW